MLQGFNFHLRPGERIALIGENGEGKTTIVKLIARLYDPEGGRFYSMESTCANTRLEDRMPRNRSHLPGFHAVRNDGPGKYRGRAH